MRVTGDKLMPAIAAREESERFGGKMRGVEEGVVNSSSPDRKKELGGNLEGSGREKKKKERGIGAVALIYFPLAT